MLGKGSAGGTHDLTGTLARNHRSEDGGHKVFANHYANAFYHAYLGNADVAFVSESTPTEKLGVEDHEWATRDMVTLQVRGEVPRDPTGAPDCDQITSAEYRAAHPDRFDFGIVPAHTVMAGGHVDDDTAAAFLAALEHINDRAAHPDLADAWQALYGKGGVTPVQTQDHLADIGERVELIPGIRSKVTSKTTL